MVKSRWLFYFLFSSFRSAQLLPYLGAKGVVGKGNYSYLYMFTHLSVIFCLHTPALLFCFN